MKLSLAITDFLLSRQGSPKTAEWYEQKLNAFLRWADTVAEVRDTEAVTAALCHKFLLDCGRLPGHLHQGTVASTTVHGYGRTLRAFLRYGVEAGWVDARQPRLLKLPKAEGKLIPVFSPRQVEALRLATECRPTPALRARDLAVVNTLLDTGCRASELLGLTEGGLHLGMRDSYISVLGKGRKHRDIGPLGHRCQKALIRYQPYRSEDSHVFQTDDGHPLTLAGLDTILKWLRDESGVSGVRVSAHTFRHTFAVAYLSQPGADIFKLRHLMGHTSVSTTELYLRDFQAREARRGNSVGDMYR
jgi:site-specific recombinase XerD